MLIFRKQVDAHEFTEHVIDFYFGHSTNVLFSIDAVASNYQIDRQSYNPLNSRINIPLFGSLWIFSLTDLLARRVNDAAAKKIRAIAQFHIKSFQTAMGVRQQSTGYFEVDKSQSRALCDNLSMIIDSDPHFSKTGKTRIVLFDPDMPGSAPIGVGFDIAKLIEHFCFWNLRLSREDGDHIVRIVAAEIDYCHQYGEQLLKTFKVK